MAQLNHKPIQVAVAIIYASDGKILITQRGQTKDHAGRWEFPGGKLDANESPIDALKREVAEEVGLLVDVAKPFIIIDHSYPHKDVQLLVYEVTEYSGNAKCLEDQTKLKWVYVNELNNYKFPEANCKILTKLSIYKSSSSFNEVSRYAAKANN